MKNIKAGQFKIDAIALVNQEGESVDIRNLVIDFNLFESIYSKFVTASIEVSDGLNLIKNFRMSGQEFIRIAISQRERYGETARDEFSIDKTFRIYKISNVTRVSDQMQFYKIDLCDPRMIVASQKRLSRVFRGSYNGILGNVLLDNLFVNPKEIDLFQESAPDNIQFICPNWRITKLIDFCVRNADSGDQKTPYHNDYFFYQSLNGGFRFDSLQAMMSRESPVKFSYFPRNAVEQEGLSLDDPIYGLNTQIISIEKPTIFNFLEGVRRGAYSGLQKTYDPISKIVEDVIYDYQETFSRSADEGTVANSKHVSGFPLIRTVRDEKILSPRNVVDQSTSPLYDEVGVELAPNKAFDSFHLYESKMTHAFDPLKFEEEEIFKAYNSDNSENYALERNAMLELLQQNRVVVQTPLRTDMFVGCVVNLITPSPEFGGSGDKLNDDRYIITDLSVTGRSDNSGVMHLECVKESFASNLADTEQLSSTQSDPRSLS